MPFWMLLHAAFRLGLGTVEGQAPYCLLYKDPTIMGQLDAKEFLQPRRKKFIVSIVLPAANGRIEASRH